MVSINKKDELWNSLLTTDKYLMGSRSGLCCLKVAGCCVQIATIEKKQNS